MQCKSTLARRVGVWPTAVYRHFANKEELLIAVAAGGLKRLTSA
ncbi:TetR family transcriptional regulator [Paraburkholderia sediminicola]